jgi:DNA transformation protein
MAWSADDRAAASLAEDLFAPLGRIEVRRMFGGAGIYADGVFFAIVDRGEIFLKADAESEPLFAAAGARRFEYSRHDRDEPMRLRFWTLPEEAIDDAEAALGWARRALAAALQARDRIGRPRGGRNGAPRRLPRPLRK